MWMDSQQLSGGSCLINHGFELGLQHRFCCYPISTSPPILSKARHSRFQMAILMARKRCSDLLSTVDFHHSDGHFLAIYLTRKYYFILIRRCLLFAKKFFICWVPLCIRKQQNIITILCGALFYIIKLQKYERNVIISRMNDEKEKHFMMIKMIM